MLALSAGVAGAQIQADHIIRCEPPPEQCSGSSGHDTITGSDSADIIYAKGGPDLVNARGGADHVNGGRGNDLPGEDGGLEGGAGDDVVKGAIGDDTVQDGARNDADRLYGDRGRDFVNGVDGDNRDFVNCGLGRDFFDADPGDRVAANCEVPF